MQTTDNSNIVERLYADADHARDNLPRMVEAVQCGIDTAREAASTIQSLRDELNMLRADYADCNTERLRLEQRVKEQDELLEKVLADNKRLNDAAAFHDAWKADAT